MTEVNPPFVLQGGTINHPALLFRRPLSMLLMEGVGDFSAAGTDFQVTQRGAGANMSVDVAKGGAVVQGDDVTDQGLYFVYNDGTVNKVVPAADATNPRLDIVVARVKDNFAGQPGDTWLIDYIAGTPAGSPVEPALPNTALKLATVSVAALQASVTNANITDRRVWAANPTMTDPTKLLGYAQVTANQGTFTAETDLTGLSVPVTISAAFAAAGRKIRIRGYVHISTSVANDVAQLYIKEGATYLGSGTTTLPQSGFNGMLCIADVIVTPSSGAHTYKLAAFRRGGTGNFTMVAQAAPNATGPGPAFIIVEAI